MEFPRFRSLFSAIALMSVLLTGCGGGGSSSSGGTSGGGTTPPVVVTPDPLQTAAAAAQLTGSLDTATGMITLSWRDGFPSGTSFRVDTQASDGSFQAISTVAGTNGSGSTLTFRQSATVTTTYRVVAILGSGDATLQTPQGQTTLPVMVPLSAAPTIQIDKTEPVSGTVQLSLAGTDATASSVNWLSDLRPIGSGSGTGFQRAWDTTAETSGDHEIRARIQTTTGSTVDVTRTVRVSNPSLALSGTVTGTRGTILVDIIATSSIGIARVSGTLDGAAAGSLTAPNFCSPACTDSAHPDAYRFTVNAPAGSGNRTFVATAVDTQGTSRAITLPILVDNLPSLTVTSPNDGAFVTTTLNLAGTATSSKAGNLTVTASLGASQFLNTMTTGAFSGSVSVSTLTPGDYRLTVTATDSAGGVTVVQRNVTVTRASATPTALFTIGAGGSLLAAQGNDVLYSAPNGTIHLRNVTSGNDATLDIGGLSALANWAVRSGRVYAQANGCTTSAATCIIEWASGVRTALLTNQAQSFDNLLVRGDYALWFGRTGPFLFNTVTRANMNKADQQATGRSGSGLSITGNEVSYVYATDEQLGGRRSIILYSTATGTSTKVADAIQGQAVQYFNPVIDGHSVAWRVGTIQAFLPATSTSPFPLQAKPISGGSVATLSSNATKLLAADGVIAWMEGDTSAMSAIKASSDGTIRTVSATNRALLYDTSGGLIVFSEGGKTYSWSATTGVSTVRIDSVTPNPILTDSLLYFVAGADISVYRVPLN